MNKLIEKELNNCKIANLPAFNENTTDLTIFKGIRNISDVKFEKDRYYRIQLADYLIHPNDNFILHIQWNNGIIPKDKIMNVQILEVMGNKMIKVLGTGFSNSMWEGWLPVDSVDILNIL